MDNFILILLVIDLLALLAMSYSYSNAKKMKAANLMSFSKKGILATLFIAAGLLSVVLFQLA